MWITADDDKNISLVDWLRQWANNDEEREELFIRSFLGRMLFGGDEALKSCNVLSGGEKVRCMLSKIMMKKGKNYSLGAFLEGCYLVEMKL